MGVFNDAEWESDVEFMSWKPEEQHRRDQSLSSQLCPQK